MSEVYFNITKMGEVQKSLLDSAVPVVLDVHATWCEPCKELEPHVIEKGVGCISPSTNPVAGTRTQGVEAAVKGVAMAAVAVVPKVVLAAAVVATLRARIARAEQRPRP